ncbi:MAG: biotin/lipoyl-binding protein [Eubacterium sp.]|nr:biotin/lipoyl-binding protein [Eubacterium sp.]
MKSNNSRNPAVKTFRVTVNGTPYEVTVEETNGNSAPAAVPTAPAAPVAPTAPVQTAAPAPTPAPAAAASGTPVKAPMPGTILDVKVAAGDSVAENQVVVILEAMKMENEIVTPVSGTVSSVAVSKGQSVNTDDVLITVA